MQSLIDALPEEEREEVLSVYKAAIENGWSFSVFQRSKENRHRVMVTATSPLGKRTPIDVDQPQLADALSDVIDGAERTS